MKFERIEWKTRTVGFSYPSKSLAVNTHRTIFDWHSSMFISASIIINNSSDYIYRLFDSVRWPVIVELRKRHIETTVNKVYARKGLTNERKL